jgi:hypothetical protein
MERGTLMAHIRRHPKTGKWQVRYIDPWKKERSETFDRKVDAEAFKAEVVVAVNRGDYIDPKRGSLAVGDWSESWLSGRVGVRASTPARDRSYAANHIGRPKTAGSIRQVALPRFLADELRNHLLTWSPQADQLVFSSSEGTPLRRSSFRRRFWVPAVEKAGLEPLRFHDLRHTHAALLIAQREHAKVIADRLGTLPLSSPWSSGKADGTPERPPLPRRCRPQTDPDRHQPVDVRIGDAQKPPSIRGFVWWALLGSNQ